MPRDLTPSNLDIEGLSFDLQRSPRRRTMQITVERDGALVLSAPPQVEEKTLRAFVKEKRFWIFTKLAEKDRLYRRVPAKEFVPGEGFMYLGRSYRLTLLEEQERPLVLTGGRFRLRRDCVPDARAHFIDWYIQHAKAWLLDKVRDQQVRLGVLAAGVTIQDLGYRWGSCGKGNRLYFHWKTILLPPAVAEYVVVHELAHLRERHHTSEFWQRVERSVPDFAERKAWLAERGADVAGL